MHPFARLPLLVVVFTLAACAGAPAAKLAPSPVAAPQSEVPAALPITPEFVASIGARIADLKSRGPDCQAEAGVLDSALARGQITLRPYMWRVGANLASAKGESNGELTIAREIDSLNIGVRGMDDVLRSAEHEAVHIAFKLPSGSSVTEALVDERVNACRM